MNIQQILNHPEPRTLFLIDGVGALLSAFMLGILLPSFERIFGMPAPVLYLLAGMALVFALYSFTCYRRFGQHWRPFLKGIAIINLSYCALTLVLSFYHYTSLTLLGWIYFIVEIIIVVSLAFIELKTANSAHAKTKD